MAKASSQFEGSLDRYFEAELADDPPYAALASLKLGEGRLGHATLELEQKREARRGWSLRKFNDWLLSFGTLPQAWLEKYGLD